MIERYPKTRKAVPAAVLGAALLVGCGTGKAENSAGGGATVTKTPSVETSKATPPSIPTPRETGSRLKQRELLDGAPALVCKALAAIINPDRTKRIIAQPIVWNDRKAPVEIMNTASSGIIVEERDKMPMEWYDLAGKKIANEAAVVCEPTKIFTSHNPANNNEVVTTEPTVDSDFKADYRYVHDGTLIQHDFGSYNQTETDELLGQLRKLG